MTSRPFRIVFLSAVNSPFMEHPVDAFRRQGLDPDAIILDEGRPCGPKEEGIWSERTVDKMPSLPLLSVAGTVDLLARAAVEVRERDLRRADMALPAEDCYWDVMDSEGLSNVRHKLAEGAHVFQS